MQAQFDVVIVGGGVVGLTLALALAESTPLSIAVIDAATTPIVWDKNHYSPRVSAITLASKRIFQKLHVWPLILEKRASAFSRIQVWNQGRVNHSLQFDCADIQCQQLGYIIENNALLTSLREKISTQSRVQVMTAELTAFSQDENHIYLTAKDGKSYQAKLAIGADGANSWLRTQADIEVEVIDYQQSAIVTTITTKKPHEKVARQSFTEGGPLGLLPLTEENVLSIVWSQPKARTNYLMNLSQDEFKQALQFAMDDCLGEVITVDKLYALPLKRQQAASYLNQRVVLVGDAAHVVHPLVGQGVNMGLLDAASLTEVIAEALAAQKDFSAHSVLRRYERWRRADNAIMQKGIDSIKTVLADKQHLFSSFAFTMANHIPFAKKFFMRQAVGARSNLPKLAV